MIRYAPYCPLHMRRQPSDRVNHLGDFSNVQIQPTKVSTRNGQPTAGSGAEVGSNGAPYSTRPPSRQTGWRAGEPHPQGKSVRRANQDERRRPQRDAADIGRNAGLQPRGIAGQKQALAGEKGEEPGRDAVFAEALVFHGQQRGGHHEGCAVDRPQGFAQRRALATKVPAGQRHRRWRGRLRRRCLMWCTCDVFLGCGRLLQPRSKIERPDQ